jgi:hypothetical protein
LCSDGLSDLVEENEIRDVLSASELSPALAKLVDMANERGGHDNITILVLSVPTTEKAPQAYVEPETKPRRTLMPWVGCALIGLLIVAIVLFGVASVWLFNRAESTLTPTSPPNSGVPTLTLTVAPTEIIQTDTPIPSETPILPTLTPWPTNLPENQDAESTIQTQEGF